MDDKECLRNRCILSKFYIKPQLVRGSIRRSSSCILSKFYIKPQLRVIFNGEVNGCILSKFYIKPQQKPQVALSYCSCILSKFYIKPQHLSYISIWRRCCILSKFYIKPQLLGSLRQQRKVVSYRNSTSNHNLSVCIMCGPVLYLIEILHQTTTIGGLSRFAFRLYLIEILHQTTTCSRANDNSERCILSKFYIKPQPIARVFHVLLVVSYRNSTSNHNTLILRSVSIIVVSYRNSTSNHNVGPHID